MAAISGRVLAEHNIFTRSSPVGRKSLARILRASGDPGQIHKLKIKDSYRNVNADIFNAYMKTLGIGVEFYTDIDNIENVIMDVAQPYSVHGFTVLDTPLHREIYEKCFDEYRKVMNDNIFVLDEKTDLNTYVWDLVFEKLPDIDPGIQQVCRNATIGEYEKAKIDAADQENDEEDDG